jgi:tetratricopeptide (TPR) repeat protein
MDDVYRKRADIFASIDMPDNAVSNYNYAIMLNPTNRMAFEGRAQANAKLGRKINSALDVLTAKDLSREEAKQYWKQALRALGKSDTETALHMYGMSLETDPTGSAGSGNPGDTYYDRGVVYLHEKQYEQALIDFKKTVTLNPKNWKAYSSLGICYFELGYYQMASEQFRGSLRNNSRDELSVYYLGRIEMKMSRPAKAIEEFTSAIDLEPKLLQAYSERADAFLAMESFQNAVGDYSLLVDKGWNDPTVLLKRGIAYDALSMYDDAVADFSEYIRVSPRNDAPMGFLYRGNSFMEMKKYAMANRDYSKFISTVMTNGPYDTNSVAVALTNMNKCFLVLVKRRKI